MNEYALYHKPETQYAYAKSEDVVSIRLRTAKDDRPTVYVIYGGKYSYALNRLKKELSLSYTDRLYNYYTVDLQPEDKRLVYVFEIREKDKTYYYSEDGLTETYDFALNFYNAFQIAYINPADIHRGVHWMKQACFYQIFIDRFRCGNEEKNRSYINLGWGELPGPTSFAGGDLNGITDKLGYLQELGINALYLTPVFQSVSNHKYDTEDYYVIDAMFGNESDFARLADEAHRRGIRIVLDAVFNHVSMRCKQFRDVLEKGRDSRYFDWFVIHGDKADTVNVNYECFASCGYMPKWNTSNREVREYLIGVALHWTKNYDIDGWRLDVSDEISHAFWREFRQAVKDVKPECVIIGENWHDANSYLAGDQYDSITNYAFTKACLDYFAFGRFSAKDFAEKLNEILMRNTDTVNGMMLNLLDSHDTHRFITQAGGDVKKLESALAVLYMFVGAPSVYYGTEIAMPGGYDPDCRRTMDWKMAEKREAPWGLLQTLTTLKKSRKELSGTKIKIYSENDLLIIERYSETAMMKLTVNGTTEAIPRGENILCTNAKQTIGLNEFMIELTGIDKEGAR